MVEFFTDKGVSRLQVERKFNDNSAWNHFIVTLDAISGEGMKIYVNGELGTDISQDSLNSIITPEFKFPINKTGLGSTLVTTKLLSMDSMDTSADIQFIDGQVLGGEFFLTSGVAREFQLYPMKFDEWFGTRGYHLSMKNPSKLNDDTSPSDDDWDTITLLRVSSTSPEVWLDV